MPTASLNDETNIDMHINTNPFKEEGTYVNVPNLNSFKPTVQVLRTHDEAQIPKYAHVTDSGVDLVAVQGITVAVGMTYLVPTGISIKLPPNTEAQVRPRSGLALKHGITVLNSPGTVDEGYRGEIGVIITNLGREPFKIEVGMRIAQLVICPVIRCNFVEVDSLDETDRGEGGFGSTGTHV